MKRPLVLVVVAVAALVVAASTSATAGARADGIQRVTLIGDSIADEIPRNSHAVALLRQGVDLRLEVAACRRVDALGCPIGGAPPPANVVDLVRSLGSKLGPNVVVAVGYNDYENQYARSIETALTALKAAGVERVWWLTLRAERHSYVNMNAAIEEAARRNPELSVIDWNVYSRSHPDWFQNDGLHLLGPGAEAMARLINKTLLEDGVAIKPVRVATSSLPVAHRGKRYSAKLVPNRGVAPYSWSLLARAPRGLHLLASGAIAGKPLVKPGSYVLNVRVKDSSGTSGTRRLTLRVTP